MNDIMNRVAGEGNGRETALPFAHLPRPIVEAFVEAAIDELDRRDGDPDDEDSDEDRGELDHLPDDDALDRYRFRFMPASALVREGGR